MGWEGRKSRWEADEIFQVAYSCCLRWGNGGGEEVKGMNSRTEYELGLGDVEFEVPLRH